MTTYKASLIRRLKAKSKEVFLELEEARLIYSNAVCGFCKAVCSYCLENNINNPLEDITEEKKDTDEINSDFKSLFRKIAVATHPDKVSSEEKREKFEKASKAKDKNKTLELLSIASELKIKTDDLSYESIDHLECSILKSEEELHNIINSFPWSWYYAPNDKKHSIIELFAHKEV